jgi:hypothetical protein
MAKRTVFNGNEEEWKIVTRGNEGRMERKALTGGSEGRVHKS